ncbi:MAG: sulfite exporter TauE/SafE family protein [Bdellovibrionia bacterium]
MQCVRLGLMWIQHWPGLIASVFVLSVMAGTLGSLVGLGGGVILIPALTLGLGIDIRYAMGASLISVIVTSSSAAAVTVRDQITNIRVALLLEVATTLGALAGVGLSGLFSSSALHLVFSCLLLYSAAVMIRRGRNPPFRPLGRDVWADRLHLHSFFADGQSGQLVHYEVSRVGLSWMLMLGAGFASGLLGIGSGVLKVPAMDTAMGLPIQVSAATSNFMMGVTAVTGALAYYQKGLIVPLLAAPVSLGVLLGSLVGTYLLKRLPAQVIRRIFVAILFVTALQMAWKAVRA